MQEFLLDYGGFLAKTVTLLIAVAVLITIAASASRRGTQPAGLKVEKLNDKYRETADALRRTVMSKAAWKKRSKADKKSRKAKEKEAGKDEADARRLFVLDFKGDIRASGVASLREEITAVLAVAGPADEVVVRLENPGGAVHEHGLAASQLMRVKEKGIRLTVIVDKIAASGGYLMACIANHIVAAPFAVIGSIGVIAQIPNFNRALESRGVDFEQLTAGKYKRTVTMFGKTTEEGREKLREELDDVHALFKSLVAEQRPTLDVEAVATGEHWYGQRALQMGLVDSLGSSDDYLTAAAADADVYLVKWKGKPSLSEKLSAAFESALAALR